MGLVDYDSDISADGDNEPPLSASQESLASATEHKSTRQECDRGSRKRHHAALREDDAVVDASAGKDPGPRPLQASPSRTGDMAGLFGMTTSTVSKDIDPQDRDTAAAYDYSFPEMTEAGPAGVEADSAGSSTSHLKSSGRDKRARREADVPQDAIVHDYNVDQMRHRDDAGPNKHDAHARVRYISGGRHQLSNLLNAAIGQNEALVEQFARNKQKKRDSSRRYGF